MAVAELRTQNMFIPHINKTCRQIGSMHVGLSGYAWVKSIGPIGLWIFDGTYTLFGNDFCHVQEINCLDRSYKL